MSTDKPKPAEDTRHPDEIALAIAKGLEPDPNAPPPAPAKKEK